MIPSSEYDPNCLDKYNDTIANIEKTLSGIRDFEKKFQQFQDDYKRALTEMAKNMAKSLCPGFKKGSVIDPEKHPEPKPTTPDDAAKLLLDKKKIMILTGAGLSAASGIPTFRGAGGFWTERNKTQPIKAQEFLTYKYYQEHPEEIWRWHYEFKKIQTKCKPNISHKAIAEFQVACKKIGTECVLVTQNIDDYHMQAMIEVLKKEKKVKTAEELKLDGLDPNSDRFGFFDECYEIHGNRCYMRCNSKCCDRLFPIPKAELHDEFIPNCPKCGNPARAHTLLFDESYNEEYYRQLTVENHVKEMDSLIVIGTALETNLASKIVGYALEKGIPVVEVNTEPIIEWGNVHVFKGKAEDFIPKFLETVIALKDPKNIKVQETKTTVRKTSESNISTSSTSTKSSNTKFSPPTQIKTEKPTTTILKTNKVTTSQPKTLNNSSKNAQSGNKNLRK